MHVTLCICTDTHTHTTKKNLICPAKVRGASNLESKPEELYNATALFSSSGKIVIGQQPSCGRSCLVTPTPNRGARVQCLYTLCSRILLVLLLPGGTNGHLGPNRRHLLFEMIDIMLHRVNQGSIGRSMQRGSIWHLLETALVEPTIEKLFKV